MSLMPFSSRSSSRSSGGGDAGGEKKLSNRKYTISLSFSGLITSGIITIIAIGWNFCLWSHRRQRVQSRKENARTGALAAST